MPEITIPNGFTPRPYQARAMAAFDCGLKRAVYVWARRSGKDVTMMHQICKMAHQRVGTYFHMLPTFTQARRSVWDAIDDQERRIIDHIFPKEIRAGGKTGGTNETDLKISLRCGSIYQLIGADSYNSVVGANPVGLVMSEYALIDPRAWMFYRPILMQNKGWAAFIGTPRGFNHFHEQLQIAKREENWDWSVIDAIDAGTMSQEDIDEEIRTGMPEEMARQEYLVDFSAANVGAIIGGRIEKLEKEGKISDEVQYDPNGGGIVVTCDIGYRDTAAFWFWQAIPGGFQLLAYDEDNGLDAPDWIERLKAQPLPIARVMLPHDAKAKTMSSKHSVLEQFLQAGFKCGIVPQSRIVDRINAARSVVMKCRFAKTACKVGLKMLRDWAFKYDEEKKTFSREPDHNYASHGGDAFSYGCQSIEEFVSTPSPQNRYRDIGQPADYAFHLEQLFSDRGARRIGEAFLMGVQPNNIRPLYETEQDRNIERAIADTFADVMGWHARKLQAIPYRVDFAFVLAATNVIVAFAECKRRNHDYGTYPTVFLSLAKWMALCALRRVAKRGAYFVVRFNDGDYAVKVDPACVDALRWNGRTDRDDPADMEPCVHLPVKYFAPV